MTDCENSSDGEEFLDDCLDITRLKEFMSAYEIERLHDHIENKTQKTIEYLEISKEEDRLEVIPTARTCKAHMHKEKELL